MSYNVQGKTVLVTGANRGIGRAIVEGPIATDMSKNAGMEEIAEPTSLVSDAIWQSLKDDQFHAFPDSMAKQIGSAHKSFADNIIDKPLA